MKNTNQTNPVTYRLYVSESTSPNRDLIRYLSNNGSGAAQIPDRMLNSVTRKIERTGRDKTAIEREGTSVYSEFYQFSGGIEAGIHKWKDKESNAKAISLEGRAEYIRELTQTLGINPEECRVL